MLSRRQATLLLGVCLAAGLLGVRAAAQSDSDGRACAFWPTLGSCWHHSLAAHGQRRPAGHFTLGPFKFQKLDNYHYELAFLAFVAVYVVNIYLGKNKNEKLAIHWTAEVGASNTLQWLTPTLAWSSAPGRSAARAP